MDGGIIHNDNGLVWQSSTKATKEEAELICPYPFSLGVIRIQELMVEETLLGEGTNQGDLFRLRHKAKDSWFA